jgi:hypothetical protein
MDPIDAYSEFLNTPTLMSAPLSTTARDGSYYIWLFKNNGKICSATIPRELNKEFIKHSTKIAMNKVKEKSFSYKPLESLIPNYIAQANYWNEQLQINRAVLLQQNTLAEVESLTKRFKQLQDEHSRLIQNFESLQSKEKNNTTFLKTLELALNIGSFIVNNSSISAPVTYDPEIVKSQNVSIKKEIKIMKKNIDETSSKLDDTNKKIKTYYRLM